MLRRTSAHAPALAPHPCDPQSWDIIQALRAKMDEIRKEFNEKYQEYIKLDKNYNNYIRAQKRKE